MVVAKHWMHEENLEADFEGAALQVASFTMPGPRAKQNAAKKNKTRTVSVVTVNSPASPSGPPSLPPALQPRLLSSLDELSSDEWDDVVRAICNHIKVPGMSSTRAALASPC